MIRAVSREGVPLGKHVGALLTWNTLGAVLGVLFTGFVLMPIVGLRNAFGALALVLAIAGLLLGLRYRLHLAACGAAVVGIFVCSLFVFGAEGWQQVISSGMFRIVETEFDPLKMEQRKQTTRILFYKDAADATVAVEQSEDGHRVLTINGKPDASTFVQDLPTQYFLAHLPLLAKPEAKDVFLLGWGSGVTAAAILGYPIDKLVLAENCDPVIEAAGLFDTWNREALKDPRVRLRMDDGRTVLKLYPQKYDVVITAPSNPWSAGVGSVFSRDFYELAASKLKPGGLVVQWFQMYEMQDDIVQLLLRTFKSVFPYVEIWDPTGGDIVMIGSLQPWQTGPEQFRKGFEIERVRADLWALDIRSPEALMARQLASQATGAAIPGDGPIQSDLSPRLEYVAPKALFLQQFCKLLEHYDERTFQQLLAPPEKRRLLESLPEGEVQLVFGSFATINAQLFHAVFGGPRGVGVPCVFRTPRSAPAPASSGSVYDVAQQYFAAGKVAEARLLMTQVLQQHPGDAQAAYLLRVFERAK
jgi:spermidine synthase